MTKSPNTLNLVNGTTKVMIDLTSYIPVRGLTIDFPHIVVFGVVKVDCC